MALKTLYKHPLIIALLTIFTMAQTSFAQQDPLYTQYMFNTLSYNPAYAGTRGMASIMALSRHQWVGFEGAPRTQTLTGHLPFANNTGLGLSIIHDQLEPTTQTGVYVDYAYRLKLGEGKTLSLGLKGGFNYFNLDIAQLLQSAPNDPALDVTSNTKFLPNFGFGLFFYTNRYFIGASIPKLLENKLVNGDIAVLGQAGAEARHYFLTGGYVFDLSSEVKCKPTVLARLTHAAPLSVDLHFTSEERSNT